MSAQIDCEGCELDLFDDLLTSGTHHLLPAQIAIELHSSLNVNTAADNSAWAKHFSALTDRWPVHKMLADMYWKAGFSVASYLPGEKWAGYCCSETLLARTFCVGNSAAPCVTLPSLICGDILTDY